MSRRGRHSNISQTSTTQRASLSYQEDTNFPPFFNITYSAYGTSPLYVGSESLTESRLELLAQRLRDTLVGDVIRGIQIGLEASETPHGQVGLLRSVKLRWFQASDVLGDDGEGWDQIPGEQKRGLWIEIRHENAIFVAFLLPGLEETGTDAAHWKMQPSETPKPPNTSKDNFINLPLLLMRMPAPLKTVITNWISTTFDCHVNKLVLGTNTIITIWEDWIRTMGLPSSGPDFQITLAFNAPLPEPGRLDAISEAGAEKAGLRSLDITIRPSDLRRFVRAGKALPLNPSSAKSWDSDPRERRRLAGPNSDDGWAWRLDKHAPSTPFTDALAAYLDHHLALNLLHPSVRVTQISCAGFVLAQSRVKVMKPGEEIGESVSKAAWMVVSRLGKRGAGEGLPSVFS